MCLKALQEIYKTETEKPQTIADLGLESGGWDAPENYTQHIDLIQFSTFIFLELPPELPPKNKGSNQLAGE